MNVTVGEHMVAVTPVGEPATAALTLMMALAGKPPVALNVMRSVTVLGVLLDGTVKDSLVAAGEAVMPPAAVMVR